MNRKILALALAVVMVFGLVACGGSSAPAATNAPAAAPAAPAASSNASGFYAGKTVEMIVPWGAGGGADVACRLVCSYVEKELGCTIVINNVTGGGGSIGLAQMVKAPNDGLTLAYVANTDSNGDLMLEGVPYSVADFAPVCRFASDPHVIVASNASGITDVASMTAAGADGKTLWGIGGAWTHWDFLKLEFEAATSTSFKRMVYDGGAAVMTDIMNGDCTVATPFISEAIAAIDAKEAVPVAVTSAERNPACPDIPTVSELIGKPFDSTMWRGFAAPAGTDAAVLKEFAAAVGAACANADFQAAAVKSGLTPSFIGFDEFQTFWAENHESVKAYYEANKNM